MQLSESVPEPEQPEFPPHWAGLHVLVLVLDPPPQVTVQEPHEPQEDQ